MRQDLADLVINGVLSWFPNAEIYPNWIILEDYDEAIFVVHWRGSDPNIEINFEILIPAFPDIPPGRELDLLRMNFNNSRATVHGLNTDRNFNGKRFYSLEDQPSGGILIHDDLKAYTPKKIMKLHKSLLIDARRAIEALEQLRQKLHG